MPPRIADADIRFLNSFPGIVRPARVLGCVARILSAASSPSGLPAAAVSPWPGPLLPAGTMVALRQIWQKLQRWSLYDFQAVKPL
jgi:hypothetical protein